MAQPGPGEIPWISESPGSKGADPDLKELTTHRGTVDPGPTEPRTAVGSVVPADVGGIKPVRRQIPQVGWVASLHPDATT